MAEPLDTLDRRWRAACRILFRQEVGALSEFMPYLEELIAPNLYRKSSISGKEVAYGIKRYAEGSKWISFDEIGFGKKFEPLGINEIKDLDSLVSAVSERAYYAGNVLLGNCSNVERSTNITDGHYIYNSAIFGDSKYLANCFYGRLAEDCFGTYGPGESTHCIRCTQTYRDYRCFELWNGQNCSDCYYVYNLQDCSDCIFCFHVKNKRRAIGNLELEAGKYNSIKEKLLSEMADGLKKNRKLPSLLEIARKAPKSDARVLAVDEDLNVYGKLDKGVIEREFSKTAKLVLGKELTGIDEYGEWLKRNVFPIVERKSAASGRKLLVSTQCIALPEIPRDRIISVEEAQKLGETVKMATDDVDRLKLSNAHEKLGPLAYFNMEFQEGNNRNIIESVIPIDSADCYRVAGTVYSKHCAYMFWPRNCEHMYGCEAMFDSSFCINCYYSQKLTRCLECDSCRDCSDSYFCHNCENVRESVFCFNVKNMRYAIGNVEVGKEEYERVKKLLLSKVAADLAAKKDCKLDIYNIGAKGKG